jgi:hypothetical protein
MVISLTMVGFAIIILTILILAINYFVHVYFSHNNLRIIGVATKYFSLVNLTILTLLVINLAKFIYSWLV